MKKRERERERGEKSEEAKKKMFVCGKREKWAKKNTPTPGGEQSQ